MIYTRRDWGARAATSGPGPLHPSRVEGIAVHWPAMSNPLRGFAAVAAALRSWQAYHMGTKGWSDIAYQVAVDQDGNRYELRGIVTQSGANGDDDVNERFGAVLLIIAPGEHPTAAMTAEVRRVVTDFRKAYPRAMKIVGHGQIRPGGTACPGPVVQRLIVASAFEPDPAVTYPLPGIRSRLRRKRAAATSPARKAWLTAIIRSIRRGPGEN